jgi:hypothetical protein
MAEPIKPQLSLEFLKNTTLRGRYTFPPCQTPEQEQTMRTQARETIKMLQNLGFKTKQNCNPSLNSKILFVQDEKLEFSFSEAARFLLQELKTTLEPVLNKYLLTTHQTQAELAEMLKLAEGEIEKSETESISAEPSQSMIEEKVEEVEPSESETEKTQPNCYRSSGIFDQFFGKQDEERQIKDLKRSSREKLRSMCEKLNIKFKKSMNKTQLAKLLIQYYSSQQ